MPKVSIIVPNYNHSRYLNQRIDAVLAQTYHDFELIILDDCSTDNSREVIEQYRANPKVSYIVFNETNSGTTFKQWKKGIELAKGEYIWMAESDDWCEPNLLETLVNGLESNKGCVIAYAQTYVVRNDNNIEKTSFHPQLEEVIEGKKYIAKYLAEACTIWNASMMLFKKECYFNISQTYTTFKMCGDWLFYIEMARQGDVFISGKLLNYFRNHDKDVSGKMYSTGNNYPEELKILKILKKESLISEAEFKEHLLAKFIRFIVFKHKFAAGVTEETEKAFYDVDGVSYKRFLTVNSKIRLFKIKARRRLNLMLK